MSQIEFSQIFTQILGFLLMLWVMKKFAWKPLFTILDTRKKKIEEEFETIKAEKEEVSKLFASYRTKERLSEQNAQKKMEEALAIAHSKAKEIEKQAQEKAIHIVDEAEKRAKAEKQNVESEIKTEIINVGTKMAEAILKKQIDSEKQTELINDFFRKTKP